MNNKKTLILIVVGVLIGTLLVSGCTSYNPPSNRTGTQTTGNNTSGNTTGNATGKSATISISAKNLAFNMSTITVPAGAQVTVKFNNQDNGIPHTFSVYKDASASTTIFKGQQVTGPGTTTYTFTAPTTPGTYYFRCDVHPTQMNGQFIVT
jgi:plastocyanin